MLSVEEITKLVLKKTLNINKIFLTQRERERDFLNRCLKKTKNINKNFLTHRERERESINWAAKKESIKKNNENPLTKNHERLNSKIDHF